MIGDWEGALLCKYSHTSKPWSNLSELKTDMETFEQVFEHFIITSPKKIKEIIENIQYYYECYDNAKRCHKAQAEGSERSVNYEAEACPEDLTSDSLVFQTEVTDIMEANIDMAYESRGTMRERLYAEVMMNMAIEYGVFSKIKVHTIFRPTAKKVATEQLETFQAWGEHLKSVTRSEADEGGPGLFINVDGAAPTLMPGWRAFRDATLMLRNPSLTSARETYLMQTNIRHMTSSKPS